MNTSELIKELRQKTQAGMNDCFQALKDANNDLDKACELLMTSGKVKKLENIVEAKEGQVKAFAIGSMACIVELNCQTDFAARSEEFNNCINLVLLELLAGHIKEKEDLVEKSGKILKEYLKIRRFDNLVLKDNEFGFCNCYNHLNNKISVIVKTLFECGSFEVFKFILDNLCMQIAASNPKYISRDQIPQDKIETQKKLFEEQLRQDPKPKPEKSWPKIIEGKMNKWFSEICLLEQTSIFNSKETVQDFLKEIPGLKIDQFIRYELGEKLEN